MVTGRGRAILTLLNYVAVLQLAFAIALILLWVPSRQCRALCCTADRFGRGGPASRYVALEVVPEFHESSAGPGLIYPESECLCACECRWGLVTHCPVSSVPIGFSLQVWLVRQAVFRRHFCWHLSALDVCCATCV